MAYDRHKQKATIHTEIWSEGGREWERKRGERETEREREKKIKSTLLFVTNSVVFRQVPSEIIATKSGI